MVTGSNPVSATNLNTMEENPQGALNAPDSRDYKVIHMLGAAPVDLPELVNLLNIQANSS